MNYSICRLSAAYEMGIYDVLVDYAGAVIGRLPIFSLFFFNKLPTLLDKVMSRNQ